MAESTALIVKVFPGALSDYLGKRKTPAVIGYTMFVPRVLAGLLWDQAGAAFTFHAGAAFRALALAGLSSRPGRADS